MSIFVLGSLAFDELGFFNGHFKDLISANIDGRLSLSFIVERSKRSFGGCAGNIVYGLGLLKVPATICGVLGKDGGEYAQTLESWGIETRFLSKVDGQTARAVITSDLDGAQIAHFTPGVMASGVPFELPSTAKAEDLFSLGPENPARMLEAAMLAKAKGLRVLLDLGQVLHTFNRDQLLELLSGSAGLLLNEFEWDLFQKNIGLTIEEIVDQVPFVLVTHAEQGVELIRKNSSILIPAFIAREVKDATGAGDAFRAGFLAGLVRGLNEEQASQVGVIVACASVEYPLTQGYSLSLEQETVLKQAFLGVK